MKTPGTLFMAMGALVFLVACSGRAPNKTCVGLDAGLGEKQASWSARIHDWGLVARDGAVLRDPSLLYQVVLWVLACRADAQVAEQTVAKLVQYVRDGGRLLCVIELDPSSGDDIEKLWINRLGTNLGFKVLGSTTRKPRNMAPALLGDIGEIRRTFWAAHELRLTEPGLTLVTDEDGRAMVVQRDVGRGRVIVVGHPALLDENPDLMRNLLFHLAGAND